MKTLQIRPIDEEDRAWVTELTKKSRDYREA